MEADKCVNGKLWSNEYVNNDDVHEDWEFANIPESKMILKTNLTKCLFCRIGDIVVHNKNNKLEDMLVYSRNGTFKMKHIKYICNNQNKHNHCRATFFHSYYRTKGKKVYYDDALRNDQLVISSQTAFDVDYLYEMVSLVESCSVNFESLSKVYNRVHNSKLPTDMMQRREEMCRKRMTEAFFLYAYLELGQRYCIPNYQVFQGDLDSTILEQQDKFQSEFSRRWMKHECDLKGCPECLTFMVV